MQLIIDNIRSASNIGSLFRTCDAFAITHIHLCGIAATPPNKEILKTALGSTETVNWTYHPEIIELLILLKKDEQTNIIALEQSDHSMALDQFKIDHSKNNYLVVGNEVEGVQPEVLKWVDIILEIPQFGSKKSLNVAVAGGIALWNLTLGMHLNKKSI